MTFRYFARSCTALGIGLALAACSAGAPQDTSSGGPGGTLPAAASKGVRPPAAGRIVAHLNPALLSHKLLYVSDYAAGVVDVFTYPGWTSAGQICCFNFPAGECTDAAGNVWLADTGDNAVFEFSHDGRLLNGLAVPNPFSCAIDRKTGNLAVSESIGEGVAIFRNAAGQASTFNDFSFLYTDYVGYDNAGNLFVDGYDGNLTFHYAELPAGSSTFTDITLSTVPSTPGNVQWDGKYVAVGDAVSTIYRTSGSTVVGSTTLTTSQMYQFYIVPSHRKVVVADPAAKTANVYLYPAGGAPVKTIAGGLNTPLGVALSQ
ncbi:MAG TPA: hypothetical protein VJP76_08725 [Candidatus Tumulicola sp.]|nr:hypothetical protein [Candidatus Tumulicola sp.]